MTGASRRANEAIHNYITTARFGGPAIASTGADRIDPP
jgi:hypothetical protein